MSAVSRTRLLPVAVLVLTIAAATWWAVRPASDAAPPPARAATPAAGSLTFHTLPGASGDSTIPLLAFSIGGTNTTSTAGGGAGSGRFQAQDASVSLDLSSVDPLLLRALATGTRVQRATVTLSDGAEEWVFDDVTITSAAWGGGSAKAGSVALTLAYSRVQASTYDGKNAPVASFCYDVAAARIC
jgi:hypothetical protein